MIERIDLNAHRDGMLEHLRGLLASDIPQIAAYGQGRARELTRQDHGLYRDFCDLLGVQQQQPFTPAGRGRRN